jgi:hypothetical protein
MGHPFAISITDDVIPAFLLVPVSLFLATGSYGRRWVVARVIPRTHRAVIGTPTSNGSLQSCIVVLDGIKLEANNVG